jgi:hypothetical protein
MTIPQMKELIASTDTAMAAQTPATPEAHAITTIEITAAISVGLIVLNAVKALLWWKPSWQTAIGNVIAFLQTFETVLPS